MGHSIVQQRPRYALLQEPTIFQSTYIHNVQFDKVSSSKETVLRTYSTLPGEADSVIVYVQCCMYMYGVWDAVNDDL